LGSGKPGAGSGARISKRPCVARRIPAISLPESAANCSAATRALRVASASVSGLIPLRRVNS
jgi:hypothetical protein